MNRRFRLATILSFCLLAPGAHAQTSAPKTNPRYIVISTRQLSTLKTDLAQTVAQGYQVIAAAAQSSIPVTRWQNVLLLLERLPEEATSPEYWLVDDQENSLAAQLNSAASAGFRLVPNSAFDRSYYDFWGAAVSSAIRRSDYSSHEMIRGYALMERRKNRVPTCRYFLTKLSKPEKQQLYAKGLEEGYRIAGEVSSMAIMENCAEPTPGENLYLQENARAEVSDHFRVFLLRNKKESLKQLEDELSRGFRVLSAGGATLTLERETAAASATEHKFHFAKDDAELDKALHSNPGFRFGSVSWGKPDKLIGSRQMFVVMEKSAEDKWRYEYLTLSGKTGTELQDKINEAAKQGYEPKGLTRCAEKLCAIMERPAAPDRDRLQIPGK